MGFKRLTIGIELRDGKDGEDDSPGADVTLQVVGGDGYDERGENDLALIQIVHQPDRVRRGRKIPWRLVPELMTGTMSPSQENHETFGGALDTAIQTMRDRVYDDSWLDMFPKGDGDDPAMY